MKKKIMALILCVLLLFALLPASVFASKDELKLTVTTDTHFYARSETGDVPPDENDPFTRGMLDRELFYYASQQGQMNHESGAIMKKLLEDFCASEDEYLLIGGDLTNGARASHLALAQMLKEAEEKSGKMIFVTAGNHDCDKKADEKYIDIREFKEIYADFGFNEALEQHEDSASYTYDLNDTYRLLAIDSCVYGEDDGDLDKSVLAWVKNQAMRAKLEGKKLITMMHHSILPHFEVQPMMKGYMKYAKQFADWGIKYVFTGHIHANDITMAQSDSGNTIYDIQTGSLITSPCAYRHVTFSEDAVDIRSSRVSAIDVNDLPDGYSEEQLALIRSDFPAYADRFFEAGICRWLNRYIGSAGKVGKTLKLKEDGKAYALLNSLMLKIGDALLLPVYDDGSTPGTADTIQEYAESVGFTVPESGYKYFYQAAAKVMSGFYHGDEPASVKETESPLILDCVKVALAHSITNMLYSGFPMSEFDELMISLTGSSPREGMIRGMTAVNYAAASSGKLVTALVEPLLAGLSCDYSLPADLNVTLEGYGSAPGQTTAVPLSFLKKICLYFRNVFEKLFGFLR